ncbi:MAG: right-handed parallel beta-helix repeat-containing protein [Bacteroidota bacterium]|nr:right-handed parallel beta-helix repeat-containing protein [Bacteroidota bacterium]
MKNHFKRLHLVIYWVAAFFTFGCDKENENEKALRVPEQFKTIQQAVDAAKVGDIIHVAPGTYNGSVHIIGAGKNDLQIIAKGSPGSVELVGDHKAMDEMNEAGFYLQDVSGVLIKGFKVRDFGMGPHSGMGESFLLVNAHNNRIEQNEMTASDMMGVTLSNSSNNLVANNSIYLNDIDVEGRVGSGCGVHIQGAKAEANKVHHNEIWGNPYSGVMIRLAGPGNEIKDNIFREGGLWGVTNRSTDGTIIENNQITGHQGFKVDKPMAPWIKPEELRKGVGIDIAASKNTRVIGNRLSDNKTADIEYDGLNKETNIFERNE